MFVGFVVVEIGEVMIVVVVVVFVVMAVVMVDGFVVVFRTSGMSSGELTFAIT